MKQYIVVNENNEWEATLRTNNKRKKLIREAIEHINDTDFLKDCEHHIFEVKNEISIRLNEKGELR